MGGALVPACRDREAPVATPAPAATPSVVDEPKKKTARVPVFVARFGAAAEVTSVAENVQRVLVAELSRSAVLSESVEVKSVEASPRSLDEARALARDGLAFVVWGQVLTLDGKRVVQPNVTASERVWHAGLPALPSVSVGGEGAAADDVARVSQPVLDELLLLLAAAHRATEPALALRALHAVAAKTSRKKAVEGMVFYKLGRRAEASAAFAEALELDEGDAIAASALALTLFKAGERDVAQELSSRAKAARPELSWPYGNLARIHMAAGEYARAEQEANAGLALNDRDFLLRTELGTAQLLAGRLDDASRTFARAAKDGPDYDHARLLYVVSLVERGEGESALAEVQAMSRSLPKMRDVYGAMVLAVGKGEPAAWARAVELVDAQPAERRCRARLYLGSLRELAGFKGEAARRYGEAARECPAWAPHRTLGARAAARLAR
jgi:tetratricopeptide (TPR) repeat protein